MFLVQFIGVFSLFLFLLKKVKHFEFLSFTEIGQLCFGRLLPSESVCHFFVDPVSGS